MDPFRTFPSVRLIEGVRLIEVVKIAQWLLTIQLLLCTERQASKYGVDFGGLYGDGAHYIKMEQARHR